MPRITSLDELNRLRVELVMKRNEKAYAGAISVTVGMGTCGIAAGALEVYQAFEEQLHAQGLDNVALTQTGCIGLCGHEPIVEVIIGRAQGVAYGRVDEDVVKRIVQEHIVGGKPVRDLIIDTTPFPTI